MAPEKELTMLQPETEIVASSVMLTALAVLLLHQSQDGEHKKVAKLSVAVGKSLALLAVFLTAAFLILSSVLYLTGHRT